MADKLNGFFVAIFVFIIVKKRKHSLNIKHIIIVNDSTSNLWLVILAYFGCSWRMRGWNTFPQGVVKSQEVMEQHMSYGNIKIKAIHVIYEEKINYHWKYSADTW